jgi:hypothetical protein
MPAGGVPGGKLMIKMGLFVAILVGIGVVGVLLSLAWVLWVSIGRSAALAFGWIQPQANDYLVRGWKAERAGQWTDALAAYDEAILLDPRFEDAYARRENLLRNCPELTDTAGAPPPPKALPTDRRPDHADTDW